MIFFFGVGAEMMEIEGRWYWWIGGGGGSGRTGGW